VTTAIIWSFAALTLVAAVFLNYDWVLSRGWLGVILLWIGVHYWQCRFGSRRAWMVGFWVHNDSSDFDKFWFGSIATASLTAGSAYLFGVGVSN
jgi:hypothetical protein